MSVKQARNAKSCLPMQGEIAFVELINLREELNRACTLQPILDQLFCFFDLDF